MIIIKDPGICIDVLPNTTDNFTVTRVSGPPCDQVAGLEKRNHQLLFAAGDGELLRHVNHKRPSVGVVNPAGLHHQNYRSRVYRTLTCDWFHSQCSSIRDILLGRWLHWGLKNALLCSLLMSLCVGGRGGWRWEWDFEVCHPRCVYIN